ncbi:MAG: hypothetical protein VR65_24900 [Desulfobulbaceae bacterium BRH_c16a]|nr:MAG: hypothetical protein VR65_24900 [Desulfobulbaceae bacterium BRH_c16a]
MPNNAPKMQSWQVFHYARKHLSRSVLYAIFGKKNARAVDYWCENPRHTAKPDGAYDPIQGVRDLIEALDDQGHCDVVRATFSFLSAGTSCEIGKDPEVVHPLPTINEEILADFRAIAELQRAVESGAAVEEVGRIRLAAIAEIDRTIARYTRDCLS